MVKKQYEDTNEFEAIFYNSPVAKIILDAERKIHFINLIGQGYTGKSESLLAGVRAGEALRCIHSLDDPNGCGFGPHCDDCSMRIAINETFEKGIPHYRDQVSLNLESDGKDTVLTFLVSTFPLDIQGKKLVLITLEDITDLKNVQMKLQQSEALYSLSQYAANIGTWEWDMPDGAFHWTRQVAKIFDIDPSDLDRPYDNTIIVVHSEDRTQIEKALRASAQTGVDYNEEFRIIWPDGSIHWVASRGRVVHNLEGYLDRMVGVIQDITNRKLAEEELKRELELNKALAELANDLIATEPLLVKTKYMVLSYALSLTSSEHGFVNTVDQETGDMIGHAITKMFSEGCDLPAPEAGIVFPKGPDGIYPGLWGYALNTQHGFYTNSPITHLASKGLPSGHVPLINYLSVPAFIGDEIVGQISVANSSRPYDDDDLNMITRLAELFAVAIHRAQDEKVLAEKTAKLDKRIKELNCLYAISQIVEDTDLSLKDILKKVVTVIPTGWLFSDITLACISFDGRKYCTKGYRKTHSCQQANLTVDGMVVGEIQVCYNEVKPDIDEGPFSREERALINAIAGRLDQVIKRKRAQEQLEEALQELKRSNADLEQFAYAASHDLQEPLRMVYSYIQLLERRYSDQLQGDAKMFMDFAADGAKRMQELIRDLLEYSRVGTRGKSFEPSDFNEIIKEAVSNIGQSIEQYSAIITYEPLPTLVVDYSQMVRLFQNLLVNAVKFKGSQNPMVHIAARKSRKNWLFSVQDNGIGIAKEDQQKIFGVFQRLHSRQQYPGTGIGLAICEKIVNRHDGSIWVESEIGKGSTFYFTLPSKL